MSNKIHVTERGKRRTIPKYDAIAPAAPPPAVASEMAHAAMSSALATGDNPSLDSVSATDRSKAFNIRMRWPMFLVLIIATVATLGYTVILMFLEAEEAVPYMLDRLLLFLTVLAIAGLWTWREADKRDRQHTQAGIRRKQIGTAERIHARQLHHEKTMAQQAHRAALGIDHD